MFLFQLLFFRLKEEVHLCTAYRTFSFCQTATFFIRNDMGIFHSTLGFAFYTVGFIFTHVFFNQYYIKNTRKYIKFLSIILHYVQCINDV